MAFQAIYLLVVHCALIYTTRSSFWCIAAWPMGLYFSLREEQVDSLRILYTHVTNNGDKMIRLFISLNVCAECVYLYNSRQWRDNETIPQYAWCVLNPIVVQWRGIGDSRIFIKKLQTRLSRPTRRRSYYKHPQHRDVCVCVCVLFRLYYTYIQLGYRAVN